MTEIADRQKPAVFWLQGSEGSQLPATTNGAGTPAQVAGYNGALMLEVIETKGGTCTLTVNGSVSSKGLDNTTQFAFAPGSAAADAYPVGYIDLSVGSTRAVAVTAISVTANYRNTFLIADPYPWVEAVISSASTVGLIVRLYAVPE